MLCLVLSCLTPLSNAQTVNIDSTSSTGNLIDNSQWTGAVYGDGSNVGCCSNPGGSQPLYDTSNNTIRFSYGQSTVGQIIGINNALSGTGIQVSGYTWNYDLRNLNGLGGQNGIDTLTSYSWLKDSQGNTLLSNSITHNTQFDWTTFSGTQSLSSAIPLSSAGTVGIQFSGKDSGFWAGLYGPEVRNVGLHINYSVDPCTLNPLYASHCPGFNDIVTSNNLVPAPDAVATWGQGLNQTFNIATALEHSGSGVMVHGIKYGLDAYVGNPYCALRDPLFGICFDNRDPDLTVNVNIRDSGGNSLYSITRKGEYDDKPYWQTYNYSYIFPQSRNSLTLGNFEFTAQTQDQAGVMNMYARAQYTMDPCVADPLFSPSCPGYFQALQALIPAMSPATSETITTASPTSTIASDPIATSDPVTQTQVIAAASSGSQPAAALEPVASAPPAQNSSQQTAAAPAESQNSSQKKSGPSLSQIQSIVGGELSRISQLESKTVSETVTQAEAVARSSLEQAEAVAGSLTEQSIQGSIEQAQTSISQTISASQQNTQMSQSATQGSSQGPMSSNVIQQSQSQQFETAIVDQNPQQFQNMQIQEAQSTQEAKIVASTPSTSVQMSQPQIQSQSQDTVALFQPPQSQPSLATDTASSLGIQVTTIQSQTASGNLETSLSQIEIKTDDIVNPLYSLLPTRSVIQASISAEPLLTKSEISLLNTGPRPEQSAERIPTPEPERTAPQGPSVNRATKPNEAAGNRDIADIAKQPQGYETYNIALQDRPFYAPKEIYKNQKTVDNQRAVRYLNAASDRLHQQMVDQQYNLGQ